jgi:RimJ/RimL family protein N-acetyltransferase
MPLPWDPVSTSRLLLTPVTKEDVGDLELLYADPRVAHWTGPWDPGSVAAWTSQMAERWTRDGVGKWMARSRTDQGLVGRGGFSRIDLDGETVLELGWVIRDHLTGQGYATELGQAALAWAATFHPGTSVVSFTEVHNHASQAVMRHLNLRPAGVIYRSGLVEDRAGIHPNAPFALYRL